MAHRFRQDYSLLELDDRADFRAAQIQYRRLVNLWHPDRFARKPRERLHAEQKFIQATKSFNNLRAFYRANARLPFQPVATAARGDDKPTSRVSRQPSGSSESAAGPTLRASETRRDSLPDSAADDREESIAGPLGSVDARIAPQRSARLGRFLLWTLPPVMVAATAVLFVVLDRNARQSTLAEGQELLRQTPPSPFRPSPEEVKNRTRRGVFLEREDSGKIGDQLMRDVFR